MTSEELKKRILELEGEVRSLRDENESLWLMLDEIKNSDIREFQEELTAALREMALFALMKKKPSEA